MECIGIGDGKTDVTRFKRAIEQSSFIHECHILEKNHCGGRLRVLGYYVKDFLPIVCFSIAHHAHLVNIVLIAKAE